MIYTSQMETIYAGAVDNGDTPIGGMYLWRGGGGGGGGEERAGPFVSLSFLLLNLKYYIYNQELDGHTGMYFSN